MSPRPIPQTGEEWMREVERQRQQPRPFRAPVGTYILGAWNEAPTGYLMADGSAVDRTVYSALFATIGTTYGAGNGTTTFNLPNVSATGVKYAIRV